MLCLLCQNVGFAPLQFLDVIVKGFCFGIIIAEIGNSKLQTKKYLSREVSFRVKSCQSVSIVMSDEAISKREILSLIARVAALSAFSYFTMKWLIDALDPSRFV